jgi:uncharacterized protein DUF3176
MPDPKQLQEQQSSPMSTSTPTFHEEPAEQGKYSSSQRTLVENESAEEGDYPLSQLDSSEDDGERPTLPHVRPASCKVELPAQVQQYHSLKSTKKIILIFKEWLLEISLLVFSILLFATIVLLLKKYDHQPMPSWSFHLNVNSMVAILSTFLRSSLVMITAQGL